MRAIHCLFLFCAYIRYKISMLSVDDLSILSTDGMRVLIALNLRITSEYRLHNKQNNYLQSSGQASRRNLDLQID